MLHDAIFMHEMYDSVLPPSLNAEWASVLKWYHCCSTIDIISTSSDAMPVYTNEMYSIAIIQDTGTPTSLKKHSCSCLMNGDL